jgi:ribosomal protein S18 acetylase RimI-like enzyme
MDKAEIIELSPDKWEEYKNLRIKAVKENRTGLVLEDVLKRPNEEWKRMLEEAQGKKVRWMFFARLNSELVGMLQGTRDSETGDIVKIKAVFVVPEARSQGIGRKLMKRLMDELNRVSGLKKVELGVYLPNEIAINLYTGLGFEVVGQMIESLPDGRSFDRVAMEKIL